MDSTTITAGAATTNPSFPVPDIDSRSASMTSKKSMNQQKDKEEDEEDACAICLEMPERAEVLVLPCTHRYCRPCITQWARCEGARQRGRTTCPVCKANYDAPSLLSHEALAVDLTGESGHHGVVESEEGRHCLLCTQETSANKVELPNCHHAFCRECLKENAHQQRERFPLLDRPACPICGRSYQPYPTIGERWEQTTITQQSLQAPPSFSSSSPYRWWARSIHATNNRDHDLQPTRRGQGQGPRPRPTHHTDDRRHRIAEERSVPASTRPQALSSMQQDEVAAMTRRILGADIPIRIQGRAYSANNDAIRVTTTATATSTTSKTSIGTHANPRLANVRCPQCGKNMQQRSLKRHKKMVHEGKNKKKQTKRSKSKSKTESNKEEEEQEKKQDKANKRKRSITDNGSNKRLKVQCRLCHKQLQQRNLAQHYHTVHQVAPAVVTRLTIT